MSRFLVKIVTLNSHVNIVKNKGFWMQKDKKMEQQSFSIRVF